MKFFCWKVHRAIDGELVDTPKPITGEIPHLKAPSRIYSYKISDIGDFRVTGFAVFRL